MGRDVHSLMLSIQRNFPLSTTSSPSLQCALKDGFGEAVVACDMPELFQFPSLDSCQKRFLWTLLLKWQVILFAAPFASSCLAFSYFNSEGTVDRVGEYACYLTLGIEIRENQTKTGEGSGEGQDQTNPSAPGGRG